MPTLLTIFRFEVRHVKPNVSVFVAYDSKSINPNCVQNLKSRGVVINGTSSLHNIYHIYIMIWRVITPCDSSQYETVAHFFMIRNRYLSLAIALSTLYSTGRDL